MDTRTMLMTLVRDGLRTTARGSKLAAAYTAAFLLLALAAVIQFAGAYIALAVAVLTLDGMLLREGPVALLHPAGLVGLGAIFVAAVLGPITLLLAALTLAASAIGGGCWGCFRWCVEVELPPRPGPR